MKNLSPSSQSRKCSPTIILCLVIFTFLFHISWGVRNDLNFSPHYWNQHNPHTQKETPPNVYPPPWNQNAPKETPPNAHPPPWNQYEHKETPPNVHPPPWNQNGHKETPPNVHPPPWNHSGHKGTPQNVHPRPMNTNTQKETPPSSIVNPNLKNPNGQKEQPPYVNPYLKGPNEQKETQQCVCPVNTCMSSNNNNDNNNSPNFGTTDRNNGLNSGNTALNNVENTSRYPTTASSCIIPPYAGDNDDYTVYDQLDNEIRAQPGTKVPKGSTISLTCKSGFLHEDGQNTYLSTCAGINKVFWNPPLLNCLKICRPLQPRNVELICTFKGQTVNCSNPLLAGTEVQPLECQPPFHQSFRPDYRIITCQENGEWDNILFKCNPDCGKPQDSETLIYDGLPSTNGVSSPWNIAVYDIRMSPPVLICGGTIISPLLVISAAHCFYAESEHTQEDTDSYRIVTGKIKRSYDSQDTDAQNIYEAREILFSTDNTYHPETKSYAADIAILILRELIAFNFRVLPACIDWITVQRFKPRKIKHGKIYGWGVDSSGKPSEVLRTADLPYISYNDCLKKVATLEFDKFCAGYDIGAGARKGDSGAGLVFENEADRLYYLRGIVSSRDRHSNSSVAKFTDLTFHIKWIDRIYRNIETEIATRPIPILIVKPPPVPASSSGGGKPPCSSKPIWKDGICEAPEQTTDKTFIIRDTNNNEVSVEPGTKVPEGYSLSFQCKEDYLLPDPNTVSRNFFARCQPAGLWDPPIRECSKICETILPAIHATIFCVFENKPINCSQYMVTGTLVYSRCDPQFHYDRLLNYSQMTCQKNGKYDVILGDCVPDCGQTSPTKLVFGGKQAELGEDPWNVAIYNIRQTPPSFVCSGTIVSPEMVVSAAHCFTNEKMMLKNAPTDYQIVVGKHRKSYGTTDSSWQKTYKVKEIRFTDRGNYSLGYFAADITVLIPQEKIVFGRQVTPACMDWRSTRNLYLGEDSQGRYVAWNPQSVGISNETLKATTMKYINPNECLKRISNRNLESDILCAESSDGSELRRTESGGGLVFINPTDRSYYLRGVGHSYDSSSAISEFTDTSRYVDWLYDIYAATSN